MGKPMENPIERDVLDELYTTQKLSAAKSQPYIKLSLSKKNTFSLTVSSPL